MDLPSIDLSKALVASLAEIFDALPPQVATQLMSPYAQNQRRLARRDGLIRDAAGELFGHLQKGFAAALAKRLKEFWNIGFDRDPKFDRPDERCLRAILVSNNNKTLTKRQLQNVLTGHRTPLAK